MGDLGHRLQKFRKDRKGYDRYYSRNGKGFANLLVPKIKKWQIQDQHVDTKGNACQIAGHNGNTYYATINNVVGNQKYLQTSTVNQRTDNQNQIFFYPVHSGFAPAQKRYFVVIFHTIPPLAKKFLPIYYKRKTLLLSSDIECIQYCYVLRIFLPIAFPA